MLSQIIRELMLAAPKICSPCLQLRFPYIFLWRRLNIHCSVVRAEPKGSQLVVTLHWSYRAILTGLGRLLPVDISVHAHWQWCAERFCIGWGDMTSIVGLPLPCSSAAPALKLVILLVLEVNVTLLGSEIRL